MYAYIHTYIHTYRYSGCRNNATGGFCPDKFRISAALPQVSSAFPQPSRRSFII